MYKEKKNEVEAGSAMMGQDEARTGRAAPGTPNRGVSHRFGQPCEASRDTSLEL